jgi:hypothetical protein
MQIFNNRLGADLMLCKCGVCTHDSRETCIVNCNCDCCNLEDIFAILSQNEFEPQSKLVTADNRTEYSISSSCC